MYDKYNQYPELSRLIGAAAVSQQFRQTLSRNPRQILEGGYLGYHFDLTKEEAALVNQAAGKDIRGFSLQVWEWMGRNGRENGSGHRFGGELPHDAPSFAELFAGAPVSMAPVSSEEKEEGPTHRENVSEPTLMSWNGRLGMDPLILVVDDNREMAQGLRYALELEGFQVALASNGERAVMFLEGQLPDLILADIKMPRMDGYALLRVVKQNDEWCDIPFVFVTAAADWREAVMAKSMGADEYIVKPFELEDLVAVARRLTNKVEIANIDTTPKSNDGNA
jgi:CheY-like chemotaxis protein